MLMKESHLGVGPHGGSPALGRLTWGAPSTWGASLRVAGVTAAGTDAALAASAVRNHTERGASRQRRAVWREGDLSLGVGTYGLCSFRTKSRSWQGKTSSGDSSPSAPVFARCESHFSG